MGEPITVVNLVQEVIRLSGLQPDVDIPIVSTGVRPGEKLGEESTTEGARGGRTGHDKVFVARGRALPVDELAEAVPGSEAGATACELREDQP